MRINKIVFLVLLLTVGVSVAKAQESIAIFAGGCFWCMQPPFDKLPGVTKTVVGYTGGTTDNPTYEEVSSGKTGHVEAIQVFYEPTMVDYKTLLKVFWRNIDPENGMGQFCDLGKQYRSIVYYGNEEEKADATKSKNDLIHSKLLKAVYTEVTAQSTFYPAEGYHQDYYKKNPFRYKYYRYACGRDKRLNQIWGKDAI